MWCMYYEAGAGTHHKDKHSDAYKQLKVDLNFSSIFLTVAKSYNYYVKARS